jgi:glucuronate isomerase
MKKPFIHENFLLQNSRAERLYHEFAAGLPIIDYHSHLPPGEIAADRRFENLAQIWLAGDHYKWRAMRAAGVAERFCTGDAPDREKFQRWAETVPRLLRNPLYHWTHLELNRPFGIADRLLGPDTAESIWRECNARLARPEFSARGILRQMKVEILCTTDDPTDALEHHRAIAADKSFTVRVLPTFRPDKALAVDDPAAFNPWIERLGEVAGVEIGESYEKFLEALQRRHDFFHAQGCRLADHGLESFPLADEASCSSREVSAAFRRLRGGERLAADAAAGFRFATLVELAAMNHRAGWAQQFHFGALRSVNSRMAAALGPDIGCDSIRDGEVARPMGRLFDRLDREGRLAKTIVYNLDPAVFDVVATMLGNFQDGATPGKMQLGSGWWFLDQMDGMSRQLNTLSNQGVLSLFVGMLTDSRSFLSFTRHEYFRRILCNLLGVEMEQGLLPDDLQMVGALVRDVCHDNAARYFGF